MTGRERLLATLARCRETLAQRERLLADPAYAPRLYAHPAARECQRLARALSIIESDLEDAIATLPPGAILDAGSLADLSEDEATVLEAERRLSLELREAAAAGTRAGGEEPPGRADGEPA